MPTTISADALEVLSQIGFVLYAILFALLLIAAVLIASQLANRRLLKHLVKAQEIKEFQTQSSVLLAEARYVQLKQLCAERIDHKPGDVTAYYYLGMAHLRCNEYIEAKRRFEALIKLDATWKRLATPHLDEIEAALKRSKPTLVDNDR
jgi:tetratricopeptide (TPR) repeat protein